MKRQLIYRSNAYNVFIGLFATHQITCKIFVIGNRRNGEYILISNVLFAVFRRKLFAPWGLCRRFDVKFVRKSQSTDETSFRANQTWTLLLSRHYHRFGFAMKRNTDTRSLKCYPKYFSQRTQTHVPESPTPTEPLFVLLWCLFGVLVNFLKVSYTSRHLNTKSYLNAIVYVLLINFILKHNYL